MERIVLATRNREKARELARLLSGLAVRFESLVDHPSVVLPPEDAPTYLGNALRKARAASAALGIPAIGDDSGLEVDALEGAPGIRSARFAGEGATDAENNARLLESLAGVPLELRAARFRCALALSRGPGDEVTAEGVCEGRILMSPRGTGGFGYDPLFLPEGDRETFAEISPDRKAAISHRARAAAALLASLDREVRRPK